MRSKTIMLCNGPLSGKLVSVDENMKEYVFLERVGGSILDEEIPTEAIIAKHRTYCKSELKFGENEIFIWEEDVPIAPI